MNVKKKEEFEVLKLKFDKEAHVVIDKLRIEKAECERIIQMDPAKMNFVEMERKFQEVQTSRKTMYQEIIHLRKRVDSQGEHLSQRDLKL
jgi:hypothetical protein